LKKYKKIVSFVSSAVLAVSLSASAVMAQEQDKTAVTDENGKDAVKNETHDGENELSDITKETPAVFWDREKGSDKNDGLSEEKPVKSLDAVNDIVEEISADKQDEKSEETPDKKADQITEEEQKKEKSKVIVVNLCEDKELTEDEEIKIEKLGLRVALLSDYEKACEESEKQENADEEDKTETDQTPDGDKTDVTQDGETDPSQDEDKTETDAAQGEDSEEVTEVPDTETPDVSDDKNPEAPVNPENPDESTEPENPETPEQPSNSEKPENPENSENPENIVNPENPDTEVQQPEVSNPESVMPPVQNGDSNTVYDIDDLNEVKEVMSITETEGQTDTLNNAEITDEADISGKTEETEKINEAAPRVLSQENSQENDDNGASNDIEYYAIPGHDLVGTGTSKPTGQPSKPVPTPAPVQPDNNQPSSGNASNVTNSSTVSPVDTGEDSIAFVYAVCMLLSCGALCVFRKISIDNRRAAQRAGTRKEIEEFKKACRLD
jgi:hypothetical protein